MTKAINNIILSSIFIIPMASLIPIKGTVVWYPELIAIMALGFVCLAMLFWDTNKYIASFLIYAIFSYIFICAQSPRTMLCLITGYAGIVFAYTVSKSTTSKIYQALAIFAGLNVILLLLQVFNKDPFYVAPTSQFMDRIVGFIGTRNQIGIFYAGATTLLMAISPWFLLMALPILLVKCSSAMVGLCVGLTTLAFFRGHQKIAFVLISILIIGSIYWVKCGYKSGEIAERIQLWKLTITQTMQGKLVSDDGQHVLKANPLFGFGLGNFFSYSQYSQGSVCGATQHRYEHAHNDLIEAFFEFGYIGLLLILLCISKVISDFIECLHLGHPNTKNLIITFCSLITLSVCSMGVYVFHAPVSLFLFCLFLGLFYREVNHAKQSTVA